MTSEKTKITTRHVNNGMLRFAGRTFNPPELAGYEGQLLNIGYDQYTDNTIDIMDANMDIIVQCPNRFGAPTDATVKHAPVESWEMKAVELYNASVKPSLKFIALELAQTYDGVTPHRIHNCLKERGLV